MLSWLRDRLWLQIFKCVGGRIRLLRLFHSANMSSNIFRKTEHNVDDSLCSNEQQAQRTTGSVKNKLEQGAYDASKRDVQGVNEFNATGFSNTGAKIEDTFAGNALTETGFKERPDKQQ